MSGQPLKIWEDSYTKGMYEKVTVRDLKTVVDACNTVFNQQDAQIKDLQSQIDALKGANK